MLRRTLFVLALVEFVDVVAVTLVLPMLTAAAHDFSLSPPLAYALAATPFVAAVAGAAYLLPLSDRVGRKAVLVGSALVTAEALFVLAWASDVFMLFMARIATGFAAGNILVAEASRRDIEADRREEEAVGRGMLPVTLRGGAFGLVVGPLLGVTLGRLGFAAAGYVTGALAVAALFAVLALLTETLPASRRRHVHRHSRVIEFGSDTTRTGNRGRPSSWPRA